jgi:acyl carrier protein
MGCEGKQLTPVEITDWIGSWLTRELRLSSGQIELNKKFVQYGMDSIHATMLVSDLEEYVGRGLSPTLAWDHPTPQDLAAYLARDQETITHD